MDRHQIIPRSANVIRKKRLRCSNYSTQERNVLIHIVEKYQNIVEGKKLDKNSVLERDAVWDVVSQEFNNVLLSEPVRTSKQLKQCYENLKRRIRLEDRSKGDDSKPAKLTADPIAVRRLSVDSDDSSSINHRGFTSSFQGSIIDETGDHKYEGFPADRRSFSLDSEPPVVEITQGDNTTQLERELLTKQIQVADMELTMKTKKYELELQVERAKLLYYQKKCELLTRLV